jgi:hypothetical protein
MCGGSAARKARSVYVAPGGRWRELGGAGRRRGERAGREEERTDSDRFDSVCVLCTCTVPSKRVVLQRHIS